MIIYLLIKHFRCTIYTISIFTVILVLIYSGIILLTKSLIYFTTITFSEYFHLLICLYYNITRSFRYDDIIILGIVILPRTFHDDIPYLQRYRKNFHYLTALALFLSLAHSRIIRGFVITSQYLFLFSCLPKTRQAGLIL